MISCAPEAPPASGHMSATASRIRVTSQYPKLHLPSRAVATDPVSVCQISKNPTSTSTPALNARSISPNTVRPLSSSPLRKSRSFLVPASSLANSPGSMLCAAA